MPKYYPGGVSDTWKNAGGPKPGGHKGGRRPGLTSRSASTPTPSDSEDDWEETGNTIIPRKAEEVDTSQRIHVLNTWPEEFDATQRGDKWFEFRLDDRGYTVGDVLHLRKWDPAERQWVGFDGTRHGSCWEGYNIARLRVQVTWILRGQFGVPAGYVVMGIKLFDADDDYASSIHKLRDEEARVGSEVSNGT